MCTVLLGCVSYSVTLGATRKISPAAGGLDSPRDRKNIPRDIRYLLRRNFSRGGNARDADRERRTDSCGEIYDVVPDGEGNDYARSPMIFRRLNHARGVR